MREREREGGREREGEGEEGREGERERKKERERGNEIGSRVKWQIIGMQNATRYQSSRVAFSALRSSTLGFWVLGFRVSGSGCEASSDVQVSLSWGFGFGVSGV